MKSYIGITVNTGTKKRLRREADRNDLSLSALISNILSDHVGISRTIRITRDGRSRSGRRPSRRVVLTPEFRALIESAGKSLEQISRETKLRRSTISIAVRGHQVPLTPATERKLARLARSLSFDGKRHE
jgi:hypothetical protein